MGFLSGAKKITRLLRRAKLYGIVGQTLVTKHESGINDLQIFAKAVHCLAKIGEEIYFESAAKGLSLRTVNSSRSAYACFQFLVNFFQSYDDGSQNSSDTEDSPPEDKFKCKLSVKSCLSVFKSLSTIEKTVERCSIKMDLKQDTLTFLLYCHHGITKTYNLSYQDSESLQAVFTRDLCPNVITAQPKIFSEVTMNFQNTVEEITLNVCPQEIKVTNYIDDEPEPDRVIRTELVLVSEEFDNYQIGVDAEVTFCLRELKAILTFAESSGQLMDIHFESAGKPIVFSLTKDPAFAATFVLATLVDQSSSSQYSQQASKKKAEKVRKTVKAEKNESHSNSHVSKNKNPDHEFDLDNSAAEDWDESAIADLMDEEIVKETSKNKNGNNLNQEGFFGDSSEYRDSGHKKGVKSSSHTQTRPSGKDRETHDEQSFRNPVLTPPSFMSSDMSRRFTDLPYLGCSMRADSDMSPGIAVCSGKNKPAKKHKEKESLGEKQHGDSVPGTPPSKKFKSMFFSALTQSEDALSRNETTVKQVAEVAVLAADTDEESD